MLLATCGLPKMLAKRVVFERADLALREALRFILDNKRRFLVSTYRDPLFAHS